MAYGNPYGYYPPPQNFYPAGGAAPDQLSQYRAPYQAQMAQMQPPMQPPQAQQPVQAQPQAGGSGLLFVLGEAEAAAYPVAPGSTVPMWDKNERTVYIKSVDMAGVPSMRTLDYTERAERTRRTMEEPAAYVRPEELNTLRERVDMLTARLDALTTEKVEVRDVE